jgi:hypothetical protein
MICESENTDDQERYIALEMSISETDYGGRERENILTKQYQSKT